MLLLVLFQHCINRSCQDQQLFGKLIRLHPNTVSFEDSLPKPNQGLVSERTKNECATCFALGV
jgi:hypothetical protein